MKEKKGFTLIELLAVIVILAIIALIATPIVLSLIEKAKHGAAVDSAYGVRKEAQILFQSSSMGRAKTFDRIEVDFSKKVTVNGKEYIETKLFETSSGTAITDQIFFELDGTEPTNGKITIRGTGKIEYEVLTINDYYCCIPEQGEVACEKTNNFGENCTYLGNNGTTPSPSGGVNTDTPGGSGTNDDSSDDDSSDDDDPSVTYTCSDESWQKYYAKPRYMQIQTATPGEYIDISEWDDYISVKVPANIEDDNHVNAIYGTGALYEIYYDESHNSYESREISIDDIEEEGCKPDKYSLAYTTENAYEDYSDYNNWSAISSNNKLDLSNFDQGEYYITGRLYNKAGNPFQNENEYDALQNNLTDDYSGYVKPLTVSIEKEYCPSFTILESNDDPKPYRTVLVNYNNPDSNYNIGYNILDSDGYPTDYHSASESYGLINLTETTNLQLYTGSCAKNLTVVVPKSYKATAGLTLTSTSGSTNTPVQLYSGVYMIRNKTVNVNLSCAASNASDPVTSSDIYIVDGYDGDVLASQHGSTFSFTPGSYNLSESAITVLGICTTQSGATTAANELIFYNTAVNDMTAQDYDIYLGEYGYLCPAVRTNVRAENMYSTSTDSKCGLGDLKGSCWWPYCGGNWCEHEYCNSSCENHDAYELCEVASTGDFMFTNFSERPTGYTHPIFGMSYTTPWDQIEAKDIANNAYKSIVIGTVAECEAEHKTSCINECESSNFFTGDETTCETLCNNATNAYCNQTFTCERRHFSSNIYNIAGYDDWDLQNRS